MVLLRKRVESTNANILIIGVVIIGLVLCVSGLELFWNAAAAASAL